MFLAILEKIHYFPLERILSTPMAESLENAYRNYV